MSDIQVEDPVRVYDNRYGTPRERDGVVVKVGRTMVYIEIGNGDVLQFHQDSRQLTGKQFGIGTSFLPLSEAHELDRRRRALAILRKAGLHVETGRHSLEFLEALADVAETFGQEAER